MGGSISKLVLKGDHSDIISYRNLLTASFSPHYPCPQFLFLPSLFFIASLSPFLLCHFHSYSFLSPSILVLSFLYYIFPSLLCCFPWPFVSFYYLSLLIHSNSFPCSISWYLTLPYLWHTLKSFPFSISSRLFQFIRYSSTL